MLPDTTLAIQKSECEVSSDTLDFLECFFTISTLDISSYSTKNRKSRALTAYELQNQPLTNSFYYTMRSSGQWSLIQSVDDHSFYRPLPVLGIFLFAASSLIFVLV